MFQLPKFKEIQGTQDELRAVYEKFKTVPHIVEPQYLTIESSQTVGLQMGESLASTSVMVDDSTDSKTDSPASCELNDSVKD